MNAFALDYSGNTTGAKNWQRYVQTFGNGAISYRLGDNGFYLQDQWRINDRLTAMYGARYEYASMPQPAVCNQNYPGTCHVPSPTTNLAPRLGLTYRLNDKTVLQAGYGMFYGRFQGGTIDNLFTTGNGVYQTAVTLNSTTAPQLAAGPVFPNALAAQPAGASVSAASLQFLAPNIKTPYSEQGNIGIQRQLTSDLSINVSYIWSRGVQLYGVRDLNLPSTTTNFTYTVNDTSGNPAFNYTTPVYVGTRPDTRYGGVYYDENGVNSYYNGMAVQVNKRFAHGLQAHVAYTWSHEIDDGQSYGESTNNLFLSNANYWLYNGNYKADKGNGTLDQRHRFVLNWVWQPTFTHRTDALSRYLVNGWQLSSITTMSSGHPYGSETINVTDTPVPGMFSNYSITGIRLQLSRAVDGLQRLLPAGILPRRRALEQDPADPRKIHAQSGIRSLQPRQYLVCHRLFQQPGIHRGERRPDPDAHQTIHPLGRRRIPRWNPGPPHASRPPLPVLAVGLTTEARRTRSKHGAVKTNLDFLRASSVFPVAPW